MTDMSVLEIVELKNIEELQPPCDSDENVARWIIFYVDKFDCCGPRFACDLCHKLVLDKWNKEFKEIFCKKCDTTFKEPMRYSSIISKIEPL